MWVLGVKEKTLTKDSSLRGEAKGFGYFLRRKSTLRRVQVEEDFGQGFLPAGRSERFWVFSEEKEHLEKSASWRRLWLRIPPCREKRKVWVFSEEKEHLEKSASWRRLWPRIPPCWEKRKVWVFSEVYGLAHKSRKIYDVIQRSITDIFGVSSREFVKC